MELLLPRPHLLRNNRQALVDLANCLMAMEGSTNHAEWLGCDPCTVYCQTAQLRVIDVRLVLFSGSFLDVRQEDYYDLYGRYHLDLRTLARITAEAKCLREDAALART